MSERKEFLKINYISDDDCGMYRLGEIDTLPDDAIKKHIDTFGEFGYSEIRDFAITMLIRAQNELIKFRRHKEHMASGGNVHPYLSNFPEVAKQLNKESP